MIHSICLIHGNRIKRKKNNGLFSKMKEEMMMTL